MPFQRDQVDPVLCLIPRHGGGGWGSVRWGLPKPALDWEKVQMLPNLGAITCFTLLPTTTTQLLFIVHSWVINDLINNYSG